MFGNLGQLMKNMKEVGARVKDMQASLKNRVVEAEAGGGMVRARMNGAGELVGLTFEADAIDPADTELLSDLVLAAVNNARKKADALRAESLRELTGGLDLSSLGMDIDNLV